MMRIAPVLLVTFLWSGLVHAELTSHEAAAKRLLDVSRSDEILDTAYDSVIPFFKAQIDTSYLDEQEQPIFDRYMERVWQALREELSWEKLESGMIALHIKVFTEEELLELAEFYESPLGQKLLDKTPQVMDETLTLTQEMLGRLKPRIDALQADYRAELKAHRAQNN